MSERERDDEIDIDEVTQENAPKVKQKGGRRRVWRVIGRILAVIVTVAIVIAAVFLVVNRDRISVDSIRRWWSYRTATGETVDRFQLTGEEYTSCAALEKGLLVCGEKGFWLYNRAGEPVLEQQTAFSNPILSVAGDYALIYDAGGTELYLIHQEQIVQTYTASADYPLLAARTDEDGWLTIVEEASGYKAAVTVYNASFQPQLTLNISSAFVTDAVLSWDKSEVALVCIGEGETGFTSELVLYGMADGEEESRFSLGNDVVLDLDWEKSALWATCQYSVFRVADGELTCVYSETGQYLQGFSLEGDEFAVLLFGRYPSGGAGSVNVVTADGEIASVGFSETVLSVSASGRYLAVLTASNLTVYLRDLSVYATVPNRWDARRVLMRSDGSALLLTGDTVNLYLPD